METQTTNPNCLRLVSNHGEISCEPSAGGQISETKARGRSTAGQQMKDEKVDAWDSGDMWRWSLI